jgi:hypothetical protein
MNLQSYKRCGETKVNDIAFATSARFPVVGQIRLSETSRFVFEMDGAEWVEGK